MSSFHCAGQTNCHNRMQKCSGTNFLLMDKFLPSFIKRATKGGSTDDVGPTCYFLHNTDTIITKCNILKFPHATMGKKPETLIGKRFKNNYAYVDGGLSGGSSNQGCTDPEARTLICGSGILIIRF